MSFKKYWVRNKINQNEKQFVVNKRLSTDDMFEYLYFDNGMMGLASDYELWQPKEGEWCWSKYDGLVKILSVTDYGYIVFPLSSSSNDSTIEYKLSGLEPFIGELPSFIKG